MHRRTFLGLLPAGLAWRPALAQDDGLVKAIGEVVRESGAQDVGVAFRNLANGDELMIHADATFHAASTMKVPVMMEVFRQAAEGRFALDDRIAIRNEFPSLVDGSPFTLKVEDDSETTLYRRLGDRPTIRELVRLMITESSNMATNLLIERVTAAKVSAFMERLGAGDIKVLRGVEDGKAFARGMNNTLTARGLATILERLAKRDVVSKAASEEMLAILRGQKFNEGIPAGLPEGKGISVAHKTGSTSTVYHDAAIVEPPGRPPYVLVVLTRGIKPEARAHRLVAAIAGGTFQRALGLVVGGGRPAGVR